MSTNESVPSRGKSVWEKAKLIGAAIAAILVLIVVLQNTEAVETNILFLTLTMPRAALLICTLLIGFGLGFLVATYYFRRSARKKASSDPVEETSSPQA